MSQQYEFIPETIAMQLPPLYAQGEMLNRARNLVRWERFRLLPYCIVCFAETRLIRRLVQHAGGLR